MHRWDQSTRGASTVECRKLTTLFDALESRLALEGAVVSTGSSGRLSPNPPKGSGHAEEARDETSHIETAWVDLLNPAEHRARLALGGDVDGPNGGGR